MKKIFLAALISSAILAGISHITIKAMKTDFDPTVIEQADANTETKKNKTVPVLADDTDDMDDSTTTSDSDKVAATIAEVITEGDITPATISEDERKLTLKKFERISTSFSSTKEFNDILTLYPYTAYWTPIWHKFSAEYPGKTKFCPTAPEFMPNIPDVPYINASCVPKKEDCRYILTADPSITNTQPDYIKLLLHVKPQFIISLVNDIVDEAEYKDANFCISQTPNKIFGIIGQSILTITSSTNPNPIAKIKKINIRWTLLDNPTSSTSIVKMIQHVKKFNAPNIPIVIQSKSGNGRPSCLTTMFLAYDEMTRTDLTTVKNIPEILSYISQVRCMDGYFKKEQYLLIYNVVNKLAHKLSYTPAVHSFLLHHNLESKAEAQKICLICREPFSCDNMTDLRTFPVCGHWFHRHCSETLRNCPYCCSVYFK